MQILTALALAASSAPVDTPNLILIVTDDQGYGDYSHAGHGALETPHLDALAQECPQVDRFYVSPVCSPTRASLMTGRWNYRTGVTDTWIGRSMMRADEVTAAELLQREGYATGIFGKWHLGDCYPMRPNDQGFEASLVHRGGGLAQPSEPPANKRRYTDPILFRNGVPTETEGFCTDVYFDAAFDFIDASVESGRPFFCYVTPNAPHDPFHDVPGALLKKYAEKDLLPTLRGKSDRVEREARICAMVENIDQNVGRLLAHLDSREIARETVVVFLSDNGPLWGRSTGGLRGYKTLPYEGGIRSPLFVRWPGKLGHETRVSAIAAHVDILPTLLDLAGLAAPEDVEWDGRSLVPLLLGKDQDWPERYLFFQSHRGNAPSREHHFAVVGPRWKLVRASGFNQHGLPQDHPFELFDLLLDPSESKDLSAKQPSVVSDLRGRYAAWFDDVSRTRANPWEVPRILLDEEAERVTTLTRQDLRFERGEGWAAESEQGAWHLQSPKSTKRDVTLLFVKPESVDTVRLDVGPRAFEFTPHAVGERIDLGRLVLPQGDFEVRVRLTANGEELPFHQVELTVPSD